MQPVRHPCCMRLNRCDVVQDIQQLKASNTSLKRSIDTLVDNATEMYLNSKRMQRAAV